MTGDSDRVVGVVSDLRRAVKLPHRLGPVLLADYFAETGLDHVELPALTRGTVGEYLRREGMAADDLGEASEELAGFVFVAGRVGWAFVKTEDILSRRRFTAAHELGHFVLHRETMGRFRADTNDSLQEADDDVADQMEREANRFAVELLMPAEICRVRGAEMRNRHGCCPREVLVYRLAAALLVSRETLLYRLKALGVGDE